MAWQPLAGAVAPLRVDLRVAGPRALANPGRLRLVTPGSHRAFLDLLEVAAALRRAIVALSEPRVAQRMGAAALAAARTTYSLERLVREVDLEARAR